MRELKLLPNADLGDRVFARRHQLKLSQAELARRVGVSSVSGWEDGSTSPGGKNLMRLADVLQVTPEWLLHGGPAPKVDLGRVELESAMIKVKALKHGQAPRFFSGSALESYASDADELRWMVVEEKLMSPTIQNGDRIVVHTGLASIEYGKVYVLRVNGALMVKRLFPRASGGLLGRLGRYLRFRRPAAN